MPAVASMPRRAAGWLGRRVPTSVRGKILLLFLGLNLAVTFAYSSYVYGLKSRAATHEIDARLVTAARAVPRIVGLPYLERALWSDHVTPRTYLNTVRTLHEYSQQIGLRYLYVLTQDTGRIVYLMDSASDAELRAGAFGPFRSEYEDANVGVYRALRTGRVQFAEYQDRYGRFRSAFLPITLANGGVVVVGADIDVADVDRERMAALKQSLAIGGAMFTLGVLLSIWLARSLTAPLARLASLATHVAAGDYGARVEAHQRDELGRVAYAFNLMNSALAERERAITRVAYEDGLTGLPNRAWLTAFITDLIAVSSRRGSGFAVLLVDLDRFRYINNYLGYEVGDAVLDAVARALRSVQQPGEQLARLSGDEFVYVLPGVTEDDAAPRAQAVSALLARSLEVGAQRVDVSGSIGVALYPQHGVGADVLLRHAEAAMYASKRRHAPFLVYDPRHEASRRNLASLLGELKDAIEQGQLQAHYQPKASLADGRVDAVEALLRWRHPTSGWVPPGQFIPFAEQTGHMPMLTRWMLQACMTQSAAWRRRGLHLAIAVNLSVQDLETPDFVPMVERLLQDTGAQAGDLCLEVTESAAIAALAKVQAALTRLRQLGFSLSIDDFGTGYSSLAQLSQLPVDELKVDRSLVEGMIDQPRGEDILRAVVTLGQILRLSVVAEGVETAAMWQRLADMGCDYAQGFLIARPMPAAELEAWLLARQGCFAPDESDPVVTA